MSMRRISLAELIAGEPIEVPGRDDPSTAAALRALGERIVTGVADDSRQVAAGDLFVARQGTATDGAHFVEHAVAAGAVAVLGGPDLVVPEHVARLVTPDPAGAGARLAERIHGDPSRALALVGITGTNGKTTTAWLTQGLLAGTGVRCGLAGTILLDDGSTRAPAELTTPSAPALSAVLARMVANGCQAAVIEASSHGLQQGRTAGLRFAGAVFTNLSGDHMDYHGSRDAYAAAKARLFAQLPASGWAVVNVDDPAASRMMAGCAARLVSCSAMDPSANWHVRVLEAGVDGTLARWRGPWGCAEIRLPLVGLHNVFNAMQAAAVAYELGATPEQIVHGLESCIAPPGRLERVSTDDDDITVLVDYAHTDDALANVLAAVREAVAESDGAAGIHTIFGCGGDRDATKRPRMARAAWRFSDAVTITSDNPRTEDPEAIIDHIERGVVAARRADTQRDSDRARAIRTVIRDAAAGTVVVIAGKGHEDYQIIGTVKRPFDDRLVASAALQERRT